MSVDSLTLPFQQSLFLFIRRTSKTFVDRKWEDIHVGNIVRVRADQTVPADILLLSSQSSENTCYLDTAAIDGETNLKQKSVPSCFLNGNALDQISFELQCDPPNDDIYHLRGRILMSGTTNAYPCDNNNVLLRGCVLRITDYVDGLVIYAGEWICTECGCLMNVSVCVGNQTKIIKSSHRASSKHAQIERCINRDVLFSSLILTTICLICAGLSLRWEKSFGDDWIHVPFLVEKSTDDAAGHFFSSALRFVILFQVMVPIALYVSLDLVRVFQIQTISHDKLLKHDHAISCRTFTINEDLGQIGYIFSDKTGTLTQNKLEFKHFSIGGEKYTRRYVFFAFG